MRSGPLLLLAILLASPARAEDVTFQLRGLTLRPEVGTGIYGYELSANLGGSIWEARSFGAGRYLVEWDAQAAFVIGVTAYEHPYRPLYGAAGQAEGETGLRFMPAGAWSPYVGVRASANGSAITQQGVPLNGGSNANNEGDLLGPLGVVQVAAGGGPSLLTSRRALVAEANFLAQFDSARSYTPARGFLGVGLHARYDIASSLVATGELAYLLSGTTSDAALQTSSQTNRWVLAFNAVKTFGAHFFFGIGMHLQRAETQLAYASGSTYPSAPGIESRVWITTGYSP